MPEGLQSSYRGMCSEDAIDNMEEASEKLDEVIELLGVKWKYVNNRFACAML